MVEDTPDGGLTLYSALGDKLRVNTATAQEVSTDAGIKHFLLRTLYLHVHPRKSQQHLKEVGQVATDKELAKFEDEQRRNMKRWEL